MYEHMPFPSDGLVNVLDIDVSDAYGELFLTIAILPVPAGGCCQSIGDGNMIEPRTPIPGPANISPT
jgi:hypothetical protein